ncbi:MAG: M1 family metallopeptidase [Methanomicrobiales archaeon]|nr:M1 family metallopeptidase [Methanomicrobiales archaeon]
MPVAERIYRYSPEDFGELPVTVLHMDLTFEIHDDHTLVTSALRARTRDRSVKTLSLNARDLEIWDVACDGRTVSFRYDRGTALLHVDFLSRLPPHTEFTLHTLSVCRPTANILEGLYYDATPAGAPPTQITQCQQWGFQRLVPCLDDMTAKCTYVTTIIADRRYTHLISNGDVAEERHRFDDTRDRIVYANTVTPMAPYLFFLGAGTWDTFRREFEYPDGHTFTLQLLAPKGADPGHAEKALEVLAGAVLWVCLFTGPEQYRGIETRRELWHLAQERDRLKQSGGDDGTLSTTRARMKELLAGILPGYRYTGTVYREIAMQNSDFGGMENVGNTTITANRIMPFSQITDPALEYLFRVKVHEFYHNLNGSEVTGRSPFELWLNEAVTVTVEQQHHAFLFGEDYTRLQTVQTLLAPEGGTFALDSGAASMPIEPDGFNDPNDLITGITYVKAPEVVRMIEILAGPEAFARGLDLYHTRFRHGNASRADWIACMEEISGQSFAGMAQVWLKATGFPVVTITPAYDVPSRTLRLSLRTTAPSGGGAWEFPFRAAGVDAESRDLVEVTARVTGTDQTLTIPGIDPPAFLSLNRGYSFYGKVVHDAPEGELLLQARKDPDTVNRFMAFTRLAEREMLRILRDPQAEPSVPFTSLWADLLADPRLMDTAGGQFLTIFESVEDPAFSHHYSTLHGARRQLLRSVAVRHGPLLQEMYLQHGEASEEGLPYVATQVQAIRARQVKNVSLDALALLDTPDVHDLLRHQFQESPAATDRMVAFRLLLESSARDRMAIFDRFMGESARHPVAWEAFLSSVAGASCPDLTDLVRRAEASPAFRIEQANDQRALHVRFAMNRKVSLETPEGRVLLAEILRRLAPVNETSTVRALQAMAHLDRMDAVHHVPLVVLLVDCLRSLDRETQATVFRTVQRLLLGAPAAVAAYEAVHGKIPELAEVRENQSARIG